MTYEEIIALVLSIGSFIGMIYLFFKLISKIFRFIIKKFKKSDNNKTEAVAAENTDSSPIGLSEKPEIEPSEEPAELQDNPEEPTESEVSEENTMLAFRNKLPYIMIAAWQDPNSDNYFGKTEFAQLLLQICNVLFVAVLRGELQKFQVKSKREQVTEQATKKLIQDHHDEHHRELQKLHAELIKEQATKINQLIQDYHEHYDKLFNQALETILVIPIEQQEAAVKFVFLQLSTTYNFEEINELKEKIRELSETGELEDDVSELEELFTLTESEQNTILHNIQNIIIEQFLYQLYINFLEPTNTPQTEDAENAADKTTSKEELKKFGKNLLILLIKIILLPFKILGWFIRGFFRKCPKCREINIEYLGEEEIDRWDTSKKVYETLASGKTKTRYVNVTKVKIRKHYLCQNCGHRFTETNEQEK